MATGKKSPDYVEIDRLELVTDTGQTIKLDNLVDEINIYQDLWEPFMQCDVVITDAVDLFDKMDYFGNRQPGFTGHELIIIRYTSTFPDSNKKKKAHAFIINKILRRWRDEEKKEIIVLQLNSLESFIAVDKKISRTYGHTSKLESKTIDKYVKSIVDEFIYNTGAKSAYSNIGKATSVNIKKENTFSPTKSRMNYLIPNLDPISAIARLANEADNVTDIPLFTFYEDSNGFHFSDITSLVGLKEPKNTYSYEPSNYAEAGSTGYMTDLFKIQEYDLVKSTDMIRAKNKGLFKSTAINIDILRKNKREVGYDYSKSGPFFAKLNDAGGGSLVTGNSDPNARLIMRTTRFLHDNQEFFTGPGKENPLPTINNMLANKRAAYMQHITNIVLNITINGNSELNVGDQISVLIPQATTLDGRKHDKYLSGIYLITKLRHTIQQDKMATILEIAKDTQNSASTQTQEQDFT